VVFTTGRIEIELAPAEVTMSLVDGLPVLTPVEALPALDDEQVRDAIEGARR
jgi:hypothetical protein